LSPIAAALVNWDGLWKITLTAFVIGTGVVIVFGLLLLGISRGRTATRPAARYALYALSGLSGVLVVAVAAIGIYALTQKPSSTAPAPKPAAEPERTAQPQVVIDMLTERGHPSAPGHGEAARRSRWSTLA
jgi:hypothetical protein